jgi:hypothetical protein
VSVQLGDKVMSTSGRNTSQKNEVEISLQEFKAAGNDYALPQLFQYIYRVLKQFLLGSDHQNQIHVAQDFDTLAEHLDLNVGAADTLMQLISGNPLIVQSVENQQIMHFVNLIARDRNPSYVNFLIALCHCDGVAVPSHQELIARSLIGSVHDDGEGGANHLFKLRLASDSGLEVLPAGPRSAKRTWMPLTELFASPKQQKSDGYFVGRGRVPSIHRSTPAVLSLPSTVLNFNGDKITNVGVVAEFFEAMLRLYQALCVGQNTKVITSMTEDWNIITLEQCQIGLYDEGLPKNIRGLFCDLVRGNHRLHLLPKIRLIQNLYILK